jgi:hypothetical protein
LGAKKGANGLLGEEVPRDFRDFRGRLARFPAVVALPYVAHRIPRTGSMRMYTARVSQTDPHAFASLRAVLRDARYANTDLYLHVEPGRYTEPYALEITSRVMIVPVGGPGTVEVSVASADSVFTVKGDRGALELYGIHVRGRLDAPGSPTVLAGRGTRFKAVDCVFTSGPEVEVNGDGTEVVNCRFDGCGLYWKRGTGGFVRDADFHGASLLFWRAVNPTVSSVRFTDHDQAALILAESSAAVTDCVMTGCGKPDSGSIVLRDGAQARFTDLSISAGPGAAILAGHEGTRITVSGLSLTGWTHEKAGIVVGRGAEASFTSGRIDAAGAASTAVAVNGGSVTVEDLVFENIGEQAFSVMDGRLSGRGLVCRRLGSYAIMAQRSRIELADVEFTETLPGARAHASGFFLAESRLDADGVRASELTGVVILTSDDSRATLTSLSAERVRRAVLADGTSTVTVHGARVTESRGAAFTTNDRGCLTVVDALVSGAEDTAVWVKGGSLTLTSVTVSGSAWDGAAVEEGGELTLEDTVVRDGHGTGVSVRGAKSRATLIRSRVTGNAGAGVRAHPDAVVEVRDAVLRDNGGGDRVCAEGERAGK